MPNIGTALLVQYETKIFKAKLLEFPELIRDKKRELQEHRQAFKDAEQVKMEIEAEMTVEIAGEMNPNNGKPMHSNAEARNAELLNRKKGSPEYQQAASTARAAEWQVNEAQADLEMLHDQFKASRYVIDLMARELALLASGVTEDQEEANKEPF